jgi:hypothetical protein
MRSEGWVTIGIDSIREFDEGYESSERRQDFKRTKYTLWNLMPGICFEEAVLSSAI